MRNPAAVVSLFVVAILVLIAVFGPMLWVHRVEEIFRDSVAVAPTRHWAAMAAPTRRRLRSRFRT